MRISKVGGVIAAANKNIAKPLLQVGTISVIRRIVITYQQAGIFPIVIITGEDDDEIKRQLAAYGVIFVQNTEENPELLTSVKLGLSYLDEKCDRIMFTPVNVPMFTPTTLLAMMEHEEDIVIASYQGHGGHPVLISQKVLPSILRYRGGDGLRGAIRASGAWRAWVDVDDKGVILNVHNSEDLQKQLKAHNAAILHPVLHMRMEMEAPFLNERLKLLLFLISNNYSIRSGCACTGLAYSKRHPMEMEFTTACDENGILTGMKGIIIADTGAYASLGGPVLHRACTHAAGPYNCQNIDIFGMSVYTNNVPSGAFRGFGVTQSCFATEMNINLLAEMVGIDPWEFRRRNVIKPGDVLPNGQTADPNTNMAACLDAVKDVYYGNKYAGLACGFKNSGTGMGKKDIGRVLLSIEDGKIHIRTSASCMGQGIGQMVLTEICHVTELDPALFVFEAADTVRTPDAGTSTASRQTVTTGEAARRVGEKLREALRGKTLAELEGQEFLGEYSAQTDPLGAIKENPISHVSYSYGAQVIVLDDAGKIVKAVSAFDVGTPVNIQSVEGQIEGGMLMGIGYGVTEKLEIENGELKSNFGTIGFLRADAAPELQVILCEPKEEDKLPFSLGAKGCGELCMIPTAPACAAAYYKYDGKFRQSLPLEDTPYRRKQTADRKTPDAAGVFSM